MGNEWIDFVRQFAKDNNITYSHAIKEAAPAYRRMKNGGSSAFGGKGDFDDIPDEIQSQEIVPYLDNNSLIKYSQSNKRTSNNNGIRRDLRERLLKAETDYPRLMTKAENLKNEFAPIANRLESRIRRGVFDVEFAQLYHDRLIATLPILRRWAGETLLSAAQRGRARGYARSLDDRIDTTRQLLAYSEQLANAPPPPPRRTMYQRLFGS